MPKANRKAVCAALAVMLPVAAAVACRFLGNAGFHVKEAGLIRSVIYMAFFTFWGVSLRDRIMQIQARRYLTLIAALMVFWFAARTFKYHFVPAAAGPALPRYLWYLYYLPMLFIPLLALLVSLSLGKPESFRLPKRAALLSVPPAALFLLVITNDLHQLVFTFPEGAGPWSDARHGYGVGYFLAAGWLLISTLLMLAVLLGKCRVPHSRQRIWLPVIPIGAMILYAALYYSRMPWLRFVAGDMTAVICLLYAAALEACIQCGLIQSNTHYRELFRASTIAAQITDPDHRVCLSSDRAQSIPAETMRRTEEGPVLLENGIRLSGAPIRGGYVLWQEDVSAALERLEALKELNESLEDKSLAAREEYETAQKRLHLMESNRLYNRMQLETADKIDALYALLARVRESGSPAEEAELLFRMAVIGAYVKRRNNLLFVSESERLIPPEELTWSVRESLRCLKLKKIPADFAVELEEPLSFADAVSLYDTMETVLERCMGTLSGLYLKIGRRDGALFLHMLLCCGEDLSALAGPEFTAEEEDDRTWSLYYRIPEKAGEMA